MNVSKLWKGSASSTLYGAFIHAHLHLHSNHLAAVPVSAWEVNLTSLIPVWMWSRVQKGSVAFSIDTYEGVVNTGRRLFGRFITLL